MVQNVAQMATNLAAHFEYRNMFLKINSKFFFSRIRFVGTCPSHGPQPEERSFLRDPQLARRGQDGGRGQGLW